MKTKFTIIISILLTFLTFLPASGQIVTKEEASVIAKNWIYIIIDQYGSWGNYEHATPGMIQKIELGEKHIGYYCQVNPVGFMVISLRKELAPVKAYSEKSNLDILSENGLPQLIKGCLYGIINSIENKIGSINKIPSKNLISILEINYTQAWNNVYNYLPGTYKPKPDKSGSDGNYQMGDILLSSNWHQREPYNDQCNNMGCSWACNSNTNALVGCVATAGAQIARYWNWPPYGRQGSIYSDTYDWPNMPDEFFDCTFPPAEVDAVAELCSEIGISSEMTYGCDRSSTNTYEMKFVFRNDLRYSPYCETDHKYYYSNSDDWYEVLKDQLNQNRPVQYRIYINEPGHTGGHSIVCDGWRTTVAPFTKEYHMNYGWLGTGDDMWYPLDALPWASNEYIVKNIVPVNALGDTIFGVYVTHSFPYRYCDRDANGFHVIFNPGQNIQFLEGTKITGTGAYGTNLYVRFNGESNNNTVLFSGGDPGRGIHIKNGSIRLNSYGYIKMH